MSDSQQSQKYDNLKEYKKAYRFSNFIVTKPFKAIGLFFVVLLLFLPGILSIESKWSPRIWFDNDHPEILRLDRFEQQFGSDTFISVGVYHPDGIFKESSLKTLKILTEKLWLVDDVIRVESLSNYNFISAEGDDIIIAPFLDDINSKNEALLKERALGDDVLPDFFVSRDGTYTLAYAYLIPGLDGEEPDFSGVVDQVRKLVEELKMSAEGQDLKYYILGPAAGNDAFREVSTSDNMNLIPFMFSFIVLLLYLQFRSFTTLVLSLGLIGTTIGVTFGAMGHLGIIFNSLLGAIPGVLLAICIADAVHILTSYFHFRKEGLNSFESIRYSLTKNFQPTILTSISTAISFFSITRTDIAPIRDLGILCGFGTVVAWLFTYLILGALISYLSPFLDKYPVKSFDFDFLFSSKGGPRKRASSRLMAKWIFKGRWPIIITFVLFSGASVYIALQNEVNSDPMKYFHESVVIRKAYDFTATKLDGLRGIELVVDSGKEGGIKDPEFLNRLDSYMNWLVEDPDITRVRSAREIIKKMNQTLYGGKKEEYRIPDTQKAVAELLFLYQMSLPQGMDLNNQFTLDNRRLRIKVTWRLETSKESETKANLITKEASRFNLNVETGGNAPIYLSMNQLVVKTFFTSMAMALCLVSLLLFIVYRDLLISTLAMLPNLIPLLFGGALMQLLGKPIDIGTSIVCTVCLGIAVDDTIHFVSSFKQYRASGLNQLDAITETFLITGKALVVTTILLVVGFGAFLFADFVPNRNFGMLCSMILALALVTDLLFLPALLLVIDRKQK